MEKGSWRRILAACLSLLLFAVLGFALAACKQEESKAAPGPETGMYYYDADDGDTYYITLSDTDRVSMQIKGTSISGGYTLADTVFTFTLDSDVTIEATYADDAVTLTYDGSQMRFLRAESYTVTYETNGGSAVSPVKVMNGRTVNKPADPELSGHVFLGWYADAQFTTAFSFGATPVTADTTVYARWSDELTGAAVYTVDFDLGYEDAEAPASMKTLNGKLYDVPVPSRDGYDFRGWWISDYQDAEKLAYLYDEDYVFTANTTLFALWQSTDSEKLDTPMPRVEGDTVVWDPVEGVSTYEVEIVGPNDNTVYSRATGATSVSVSFSSYVEGEYTISVRAIGVTDAVNSDTAVRYFNNKGLARVSLFSVIEPSVLSWAAVEGAQNYRISISCGNPAHKHDLLDNGSSTWFDFSGCEMKEGGIAFTVTASATGRASSVSDTFYYNRMLGTVGTFYFDEETESVSWDAVPNATDYFVTVSGGENTDQFTTDGKTSVSLAGYAASELTVSVTPRTAGYNSPAAAEYTYTRTRLAAPAGLAVSGTTLSWTAVENATSYTVSVGGQEYPVSEGTSFDLSQAGLTNGVDYTVRVRAEGTAPSVWSGALPCQYYSLSPDIVYHAGVVSWNHALGAASYQVRVNDGQAQSVPSGTTSAAVTLTQKGENTVFVRFTDDTGNVSAWESVTVYAYEIIFDVREGSAVSPAYLANGDIVRLPETTRTGFTLDGWYNVPGAADVNGHRYADGSVLSAAGDMILYANWSPNSYTVTYDMTTDGGEVDTATGSVIYTEDYRLAVPTNADTAKTFVGWYELPNGTGRQYTDAQGNSLAPWSDVTDKTLYPCWISVFAFDLQTEGTYKDTYSVTATANISRVTKVVIPETYNGKKVTIVEGYAFNRSGTLHTIEIPDTIELIYYSTAFEGCTSLTEVNVYETGHAVSPLYSSDEGVLYYTSEVAQEGKELAYVPQARMGHYTIPDDVTSIGQNAFTNTHLDSVTIPSSVSNIAAMAFQNNTSLSAIYFDFDEGDELIIGENAFAGCTSLKSLTIPARFKSFDPVIFGDSSSIESIEVADDHETYGSLDGILTNKARDTIVYCPKTRRGTLRIPAGITKIAAGAFADCNSLTAIIIPNFVTTIEAGAFENCARLTKVTFAGGNALGNALTVGANAFAGCTNLANVLFEDNSNVVSFGESVFSGSERLTSITLPKTVATLATGVFSGCVNLMYVNVEDGSEYFSAQGGVLFDVDKTRLMYYSPNLTATSYVLPETVKTIDADVFNGNLVLQSVTVGSQLETIGERAFYGCSSLREVIFVGTGTAPLSIGDSAFENCRRLMAFILRESYESEKNTYAFPENLKTIGASAFQGASLQMVDENYPVSEGLEEIGSNAFSETSMWGFAIPASVKRIGESAFERSNFLMAVTIADNSQLEYIGPYAFSDTMLLSFEVPKSVTYIGDYAFSGTSIWEFTFEEGRTEEIYLGISLFRGTELESITFPDNVTGFYIPKNGYLYTTIDSAYYLSDVNNVPESDTYDYEGGVFYVKNSDGVRVSIDHAVLNEVDYVIPNTVTRIMSQAFYGCDGGTLTFEAGGTEDLVIDTQAFYSSRLTSVALPARLSEMGTEAFAYSKVESITFEDTDENPSRLTEIPDMAFQYAPYIASITIPSNVASIGNDVFSPDFMYGSSLSEINLNEGLVSIGDRAFADDSGNGALITELVIPSTVKSIGSNAFANARNLATITFAEGSQIEVIGSSAFRLSAITTIILPKTLAGSAYTTVENDEKVPNGQLGSFMFYGCSKLQTVIFEDGCPSITSYGNNVFGGCLNYSNVTFPENVSSIAGWSASAGAIKSISIPEALDVDSFVSLVPALTGLTSFALPADSEYLYQDGANGAVYDKLTKTTLLYYPVCYTAESYTVLASTLSIGTYAFSENGSLKSVVLPEGLETIGAYAFGVSAATSSTALESVTIPSTVKTIGESAFYGAANLREVTFAKRQDGSCALTDIENFAFRECTSLTEIVIPDSVTTLGVATQENFYDNPDFGASVFYGCTALRSVTLPNGLTDLQSNTFTDCTSLETVVIKDGSALQRIAPYAFAGSGLATVDLTKANNLVLIDEYAFYNSPVEEILFGEVNEISIGGYAFSGAKLTELVLPANIIAIGPYAFGDVATLTTVTLAEDSRLISIGEGAFRGTSVEAFAFDHAALLETIGDYAFYETELASIVLPDSVTEVGDYAFYGCQNVTEFVMSKAIESIGDYAFSGLDKITEVTIYGNNTTVGDGAFENCTSLDTLTIENGVDSIGPSAFGFTAITNVVLPESISSLEGNPFTGCRLESLDILAQDADLVFDMLSKTMYNKDKTLLYYVSPTFSGEYKVPDSVSAILPGAFAGSGITSITIPDTFTTIPADAFKGCAELTSFTVGKNVTSIGSSAFEGCTSLATLTFETGGVNPLIIGERAFYGTTSLTSVVFPDRLRDEEEVYEVEDEYGWVEEVSIGYAAIGDSSFENSGLVTISYEKNVDIDTNYDSNMTAMIGSRAFANCTALETAEFGPLTSGGYYSENGGVVVGEYAFYGCSKLRSVSLIPEPEDGLRVSSGIGSYAFSGCDSLATFTVPARLVYFLPYCFAYSGLTELEIPMYIDKDYPFPMPEFSAISIYNNAFEGCSKLVSFVSHAYMGYGTGRGGYDWAAMGQEVFKDCTQLQTVVFDHVYAILDNAFENCTSLSSVTLSFDQTNVVCYETDVTLIGDGVFKDCQALTTVTLKGELESIAANAFAGCTKVSKIVLPNTVTAVAGTAFSGWTEAQTIEVPYEKDTLPSTFVTGWNGNAVIKYLTPETGEESGTDDTTVSA